MGGIAIGVIDELDFIERSTFRISIPYIIAGWSILLDPFCIANIFERSYLGALYTLIGGFCYMIGAYIYIKQPASGCPNLFTHHELFHIYVIMGTSFITFAIFNYGIPYWLMTHNRII
jgi:hemolysin III